MANVMMPAGVSAETGALLRKYLDFAREQFPDWSENAQAQAAMGWMAVDVVAQAGFVSDDAAGYRLRLGALAIAAGDFMGAGYCCTPHLMRELGEFAGATMQAANVAAREAVMGQQAAAAAEAANDLSTCQPKGNA